MKINGYDILKYSKIDILLIFLGVIFLLHQLLTHFQVAQDYANWPKTSGTVIKSKVKYIHSTSNAFAIYYPEFEYSYNVGGREYTSTNVHFKNNNHVQTYSGFLITQLVEEFPYGSHVDVYYNPTNPKLSILSKGLSAGTKSNLFFAMALIAMGLTIMYGKRQFFKKFPERHLAPFF